MSGKQIAEITLHQLGGAKILIAFVGAEQFKFHEDGTLQFKFQMCDKADVVSIKLDWTDTYTMTFYRNVDDALSEVEEFSHLYDDMLKSTFEEYTGLYLSFN